VANIVANNTVEYLSEKTAGLVSADVIWWENMSWNIMVVAKYHFWRPYSPLVTFQEHDMSLVFPDKIISVFFAS
jgi:hypothetical protein